MDVKRKLAAAAIGLGAVGILGGGTAFALNGSGTGPPVPSTQTAPSAGGAVQPDAPSGTEVPETRAETPEKGTETPDKSMEKPDNGETTDQKGADTDNVQQGDQTTPDAPGATAG